MGLFHHHEDAHDEVVNATEGHQAKISHELIAAAASYEAAKAYQEHQKNNGKPASHEKAKELLAGFGGAFIDRIIETKGLDFIDAQKAKHQAKEYVEKDFTEETYRSG